MELRHLRYFVAVADSLHFGRAAARLQIAQPSLSQQVRQLEAELETTLLERTRRRVQLTEAGRLFLEQARELLARAEGAAVIARRASLGEVGRVRVGFAYWTDVSIVVAAVTRLHALHPAITIDLRSIAAPVQNAALLAERLDVGFVRPPFDEPSLDTETLGVEPFVVALPERHRLASKKRIPIGALSDEVHLLVPRDAVPTFYDLALKVCRDGGFVPRVRAEADHPETVLQLVEAGLGVSLVPAWTRRLRRRGLVFRPLVPSTPVIQTVIAWQRHTTSPLVKEFLTVVRDVAMGTGRGRTPGRAGATAPKRTPRVRRTEKSPGTSPGLCEY
jgi:DNA-binding transcriptional LysR family regulator